MVFFLLFPKGALAAISFQISNFEKNNDYYTVDALISGAASASAYFVQAMFTPLDSNNYFGFTWSQKGEWFKYISSPDKEYIKSDFSVLETGITKKFLVKPDTDSPKYTGPGQYLLKLKRYTGESQSGTYSDNSLTVTLSDSTPIQEAIPTESSTPTPTSTPTSSPSPTLTPTKTPTPTPTPTVKPTSTPTRSEVQIQSAIEGQSAPTPTATASGEILGLNIVAPSSQEVITPEVPGIEEQASGRTDTFTAVAVGVTSLVLLGIIFYRLKKLSVKDII